MSLLFYCSASLACADWTLPLTFRSGSALTRLALGIQAGATNGFDAGKDTPHYPYEDDLLYACFPHPEWGVTFGGEPIYVYSRDVRGSLPQEFPFEVRSSQSTVTISWNASTLPPNTVLQLNNPMAGASVDMRTNSSYRFSPGGTAPVALSIQVSPGDVSPPSSPSGVSVDERENSLYVSWGRNSEIDLAGYKVYFGTNSGSYSRSMDVRNATNYSLLNLSLDEVYYIAITAYDQEGNESSYSSEVTGSYQYDDSPPLNPAGLGVTATETSLRLYWSANSETDLAGYKVYYGTDYGDYSLSSNVGLNTSYQLPNPVAGKAYYFAVSAYDQLGNESELSSSTSAVLKDGTSVPGVPDDEDVLPSEESANNTSVVGASRVSSIFLNLPGQSDGSALKNGTERGEQGEPIKKSTEGESSSVADEGAAAPEAEKVEPDVATAVPGKSGVHRIELDEHSWKLMTIPLQVSVNKPFAEFVALSAEINRLTGWDSKLQVYRRLKYPRPGAAFWLKAGKGYAVLEGKPFRDDEAFFTLAKGWNLLGSPYLKSIPFQQARIRVDDKLTTLPLAVKSGLLANVLQSYLSGGFVHETLDGNGQFKPWRGYWVFAKQACELILYQKAVAEAEASKKPDDAKSGKKIADPVEPEPGKKQTKLEKSK